MDSKGCLDCSFIGMIDYSALIVPDSSLFETSSCITHAAQIQMQMMREGLSLFQVFVLAASHMQVLTAMWYSALPQNQKGSHLHPI